MREKTALTSKKVILYSFIGIMLFTNQFCKTDRLTNDQPDSLRITAYDNFPAWSSDGTRIAFTSKRDGNQEIYIMNVDGSDQTRLTDNPADDRSSSWSPGAD